MQKTISHMGMQMPVDMPSKLRAAFYVRKSNKSEGGVSKSLQEQLAHCHMICEYYRAEITEERIYTEELNQKGEWFWDDGTGRYPEPYRPVLTRMMRDLAAGLIDVVIIWRSDRLYRGSWVFAALSHEFRANGVRLIQNTRELDLNTSSGKYQGATEAANNQRWRDQISEDIIRDHLFKAELGLFTRDPSCLGFRSKGKGSQAVEYVHEELELVNRIFNLFLFGEGERGPLGTNGIASYLMDQGVLWPKGIKGHIPKHLEKIHETQVRTVLNNCMYVGIWRHDGNEYKCDKLLVPELDENGKPTEKRRTAVPISLYEMAQEKLARSTRPGKRSLGGPHLTTGMTVCASCGRPLQVRSVHGKYENGPHCGERRTPTPKFVCNHRRGTRPCPPGGCFGVQEQVLDDWVLTELAPILVAEMEAIRTSAGREADTELLSRLERKLVEAKTKETTKLAAMLDSMDAAQFTAIAKHLKAKREALEREIAIIRNRIADSERVMPDLNEQAIASLPKAALKDALSRAIAFMAIGKAGTGVVVLTKWGTYIGAPYRKGDKSRGELPSKVFIDSASPASSLNCFSWISDPAEFVLGRRDALGRSAAGLTDEELLPGLLTPIEGYVLEADIPENEGE